MKKTIITILILLSIIALGIKGKGLLEHRQAEITQTPTPDTAAVTVPVVTATWGTLKKEIPFLAQIIPDKSITLTTKLVGYIETVSVEASQPVAKGAPLVRIDATELRSTIKALKATRDAQRSDLALTQRIHQRNQKLFAVGGLAKEKYDASKLAVTLKQAAVDNTMQQIRQLQHQRSYTDIKAPFDGVIDTLLLDEGDLAAAGKPILRMSNGIKKLRFSYAANPDIVIAKGDPIIWQQRPIGQVSTVYTTATNGLITAEASLQQPLSLPVGSSINIEVITAESTGCTVPDTALLHKKEGTFVMVYNGTRFSPIKIHVKFQDATRALIDPCPKEPVATASEVKLARLGAYAHINVTGLENE